MAALVAGVAACGTADPPARDDSAGFTVVENDSPGVLPVWTVSATPVTDIGGTNSDPLVMVAGATMAGDRIVVADAGVAKLRFYDRAGRLLFDAGRRGDGPGEFRHLGWVGVLSGDSVAAWDPMLRRLSVFDANGRFGRSATLRDTRGPLPSVAGVFADGSFLLADVVVSAHTPAAGTTWRDTLVYLRVGRDGATKDTLGRFPGTEQYVASGSSGRVHSVPFGRTAAAAASGGTFYIGAGDRYEVDAYDGPRRLRMRKPHRPAELTPADRSAFRAMLIQVGGTDEERRERARELDQAPYPRTLPPYLGLTPDTGGNLWVQAPYPPGELFLSSEWSVFDSAGRWIATARGPGRVAVQQIGPDWVLASGPGEDQTQRVRLYTLRR